LIAAWLGRKNSRKKGPISAFQTWAYIVSGAINASTAKMETYMDELQSTAQRFIESTEGHLKVCKQNYGKLSGAREYFEAQLKAIREDRNDLKLLPAEISHFKGFSQDLDAAFNRQSSCLKSYSEILRKLEGHCARMVKLTEARQDRAILKPLTKLNSILIGTLEFAAEQENSDELRKQARELRRLNDGLETNSEPSATK
jgi:hypothetical protein